MMSPTPPAAARCGRCGNGWSPRTGRSQNGYSRPASCPRCGSVEIQIPDEFGFFPPLVEHPQAAPAPVVNVNVQVNTSSSTPTSAPFAGATPAPWAHSAAPAAGSRTASSTTRWWKSSRFWFFALPLVTGGLAAWVPPLWVASKVHEEQLKARLYLAAAGAAALAAVGGVFVGSAPKDALGNASGARADFGTLVLLIAIAIGTGTAVLYRKTVFPDDPASTRAGTPGGPTPLPGVEEAQARRERRAQYRSLADRDAALAREMHIGRPDRTPAFDDGGLADLNALDADALQRHLHVTAAEATSIIGTRNKLGRLSSVDELVVHGELTLTTAEHLRDFAVFIG